MEPVILGCLLKREAIRSPFLYLKSGLLCKGDKNKSPKQHTRILFTKNGLQGSMVVSACL